jgi:hypothetical protein
MRKALLVVLAALIVLLAYPGPGALAGEAPPSPGGRIAQPAFWDIYGHVAKPELTILGALRIYTGYTGLGGRADPEGLITRAQFAKVLVVATGKGGTAERLMSLKPTYRDAIPPWAWGYVNYAAFSGLIGGYGDGTFRPDEPVTYGEAVAMLIRAVPGHKARVGSGAWPYNYVFYGLDQCFTGTVDLSLAQVPCTRGDMARMLWATLRVDPLDATGLPDLDGALLETDVRVFEHVLQRVDLAAGWIELGPAPGHRLTLAEKVHVIGADAWMPVGGRTEDWARYQSLLGQTVLVVTDGPSTGGGKVVYMERKTGDVTGGIYEGTGLDASGGAYLVLDKGEEVGEIPYVGPVAVGLNGDETTPHTEADLLPGDWICVNLDDAGRAIRISAFRWDLICEPAGGDFVPGHQDYIAGPVAKSSAGADTLIRFPADSPFSYRPFGTAGHASLAGVAVPIPATAAVLINDEDAGRDDLQENDVIRAATFGALGLDPADPGANPIIAVWATSTTVGGTIEAVAVVYPGPRRFVTLATRGGTREFERDPTYTDEPAVGEDRQYSLDHEGRLFVEVTDPPTEIIVYVAGHTEDRTAEGIRFYLGVDELGQDRGYEYDQAAMGEHSALVGHFEKLTVAAGSGLVTAHAGCDPDTTATVLAVGPDNCTLELADHTVVFASEPVVYRLGPGEGGGAPLVPVYAGLGALVAGDVVRTSSADRRLIVLDEAAP